MSNSAESTSSGPQRSALFGLALAAVGTLILPLGDAIGKYLGGEGVPVLQIAWGRWISQILLLTPLLLALQGFRSMRIYGVGWHTVRAALLAFATVAYFSALKFIPLADAAAILFVAPIVVTALSGIMLGEKVGPWRWGAVIVGFLGVLLIIGPSGAKTGWGSLLALIAALCFAFYFLLTRKLKGRNTPLATLWFMGLVGTVLMTPLAAYSWQPVSLPNAYLMLGIGVVMALGHLLVIQGLEHVEASAMAPIPYLEMVTATLIGYFWFAEFPGSSTWAGCGVVIAAGLFIAYRERRNNVKENGDIVRLQGSFSVQELEIVQAERKTVPGTAGPGQHSRRARVNKGRVGMKVLLYILAIVMIVAGIALAMVNFTPVGDSLASYGVNLGIAATLFASGCIVMGLGGLIGALNRQYDALMSGPLDDSDYARPARPKDEIPDFLETAKPKDKAVAAGAGAAAAVAAAGTAAALSRDGDAKPEPEKPDSAPAAPVLSVKADEPPAKVEADSQPQAPSETVAERFAAARQEGGQQSGSILSRRIEQVTGDGGNSTDSATPAPSKPSLVLEPATSKLENTARSGLGTASNTGALLTGKVDEAAKAVETAADDAADKLDAALDKAEDKIEAASDAVEDAKEEVAEAAEAAAEAAGDDAESEVELYVTREDKVRGRSARFLSDGTVEAETDEGWMRFENLEHLNEYLDAMSG